MELMKVTDRIKLIAGQNRGQYPFSMAVYIDAERKILIDAGAGPQVMMRFLAEYHVDIMLVSHTHPGHTAAAHMLAGRVPIFVPREGAGSFGNLAALAARFVPPDPVRKLYLSVADRVQGFRDCAHTHVYDGRSAFDLGSVRLVALGTPGHCVDHYCFFDDQSGTMLLFDLDLDPFGPKYGNPESDINAMEASINLVMSYEPDTVVSSHNGVLRTNIRDYLYQYVSIIEKRDHDLMKIMADKPMSVDQVASTGFLLQNHQPVLAPLYQYWQKQMITKHIERLVDAGRVRTYGTTYRTA